MSLKTPKKRSAEDTTGNTGKWDDVTVETRTTLRGGCLTKPMVIVTKMFPNVPNVEFVQIRKGEQWLISSAVGAGPRQQSLGRTKVVEDIVSAAMAAAFEAHERAMPEAAAADAAEDLMAGMAYADLPPPVPPAKQPKASCKKEKRKEATNRLVHIEMPAVLRRLNQIPRKRVR